MLQKYHRGKFRWPLVLGLGSCIIEGIQIYKDLHYQTPVPNFFKKKNSNQTQKICTQH